MSRLAICPQQHVWSPADTKPGESELTCPVCGESGSHTDVGPTSAGTEFDESMSPAVIPPLVPASTILPSGMRPGGGKQPRESADPDMSGVPDYEIVGELGRGGMGVVYLARHKQLKRLVALKVIRGDVAADDEALARFRREAEAIARLQHPGIVQIHDFGTHRGSPYLALEYIDGENLAEQLRGAIMMPRLAAALVESLARTVHYAHQHGIVHRDLTPRNILLARDASCGILIIQNDAHRWDPKITDFGLAKELDADVQQTQSGVIMGTPSYMSPEQALGRPDAIGPATDIHALGALLYETLTGRPPFLAANQFETLMQVIEREPVSPRKLQPTVPRDLETICMKCLEKESSKRYESAESLADDLRRFLDNAPIHARPVSFLERTWKLSRRHPAAAALIAVSILAATTLIIGGITYNTQLRAERDRTERNLGLAMEAIDKMLTEVGEEQLAVEPRMEKKRQRLLSQALALYEQLLEEKKDDPRVLLETAQAHRRVADLFRLLGDNEKAIVAYNDASTMLVELNRESPDNPSYRRQMAHCNNMRGEALRTVGRLNEAEAAYAGAQSQLEVLVAAYPGEASYREELASVLYNSGILRRQTQQPADAEREFRRAIALLSALGDGMRTADQQQHLARAYLNLGTVISSKDRFDEVKLAYDASVELLTALTMSFPEQPDYQHERSVALNNLGNLMQRSKRYREAKANYARAREGFEKLARDFPRIPIYRQELANSFNSAGSVALLEEDIDSAIGYWTRAAELLERLIAENPELAAYRSDLGMVLGNLGRAYRSQSQLPQAREKLEQAIEHLKQIPASSPDQEFVRNVMRGNHESLGDVLLSLHDHAAAANCARTLCEIASADANSYYTAARVLAQCSAETANDQTLDTDERRLLAEVYAGDAIVHLNKAADAGFADAARLEKDRSEAFKAVAGRTDFAEIAARIVSASNAPN